MFACVETPYMIFINQTDKKMDQLPNELRVNGTHHYCTHYVHPLQHVDLLRHYDNEYDSNAIAVVKTGQHQYMMGYIQKEQAAVLAPLMDSGELRFMYAHIGRVQPMHAFIEYAIYEG